MHNLCYSFVFSPKNPLCVCVSHNYLDIHTAFTDGGQGQTETYNLSWPPTRRMRDICKWKGCKHVASDNYKCLEVRKGRIGDGWYGMGSRGHN